jgi:hypothetical protein
MDVDVGYCVSRPEDWVGECRRSSVRYGGWPGRGGECRRADGCIAQEVGREAGGANARISFRTLVDVVVGALVGGDRNVKEQR